MKNKKYKTDPSFRLKSIQWASSFDHFAFLNYNELPYHFGAFPCTLAVGAAKKITGSNPAFESIKEFYTKEPNWLFGYLGYDLKNQIENLSSSNEDNLNFPDYYFFQPVTLLSFSNEKVEIISKDNPDDLYHQIESYTLPAYNLQKDKKTIRQKIDKDQYLKNVGEIKKNLLEGDIYELNYCMEFYVKDINIDPLQTFLKLNTLSPMPFSVFMRMNGHYLISASPERFLKKEKTRLLSQPIKGTSRRGLTKEEDSALKHTLFNSEKERAENMMIVDLVRNDLARSSKAGTVKVEELFGIYTFPQVHQMISTVSSEIHEGLHFIDAIKNAFPMGSMTGAPKFKAMELIEKFEESKRGLFSGAAGWINPEGDFDFNVVIRSLLYSQDKKYLSFQVGSAITYDSDPEKEYEECLLKAEAMKKVLEEL